MSIKGKLFLVRGGARTSRFKNKNESEAEYLMEKKAVKPKKVKVVKPAKEAADTTEAGTTKASTEIPKK